MEKKYICVRDFQGGSFGMYRTYTAKEWGEQAYEWADSDNWENPDECLLESFKTEQDLIDFIADMWEIQIEELSKDNIEVVEYLLQELKEIKEYDLDFNKYQKEWIIKTAQEIGVEE